MTYNDLLNWAAEQQLLAKETTVYIDGIPKYDTKHVYMIENELSEQEKIVIINQHDTTFIQVINLIDLLQKESSNIKRDDRGDFKTVSLKAWLNKNDINNLTDHVYYYGSLRSYYKRYGCYYYITDLLNYKLRSEFINDVFHNILVKMRKAEMDYYFNHDEYTVLKRRWKDEHISDFGVTIGYWSSGRMVICDPDNHNKERDITIDELQQLLEMNQQVKDLITNLSNSCTIKY